MIAHLHIIVDGGRPEAVDRPVVTEGRDDVQQIDHHGCDADDALVHGRRGPRGPAALGRAGHDEAIDLVATRLRAAQNACTVSMARTTALVIGRRSGQSSSPVRMILIPRVGDDAVLRAALLVIGEHQGFVRDVLDGGATVLVARTMRRRLASAPLGARAVAAAAVNEHKGRWRWKPCRNE